MIKSPRILPQMFQILPLTWNAYHIIINSNICSLRGESMERRRYVSIWNWCECERDGQWCCAGTADYDCLQNLVYQHRISPPPFF